MLCDMDDPLYVETAWRYQRTDDESFSVFSSRYPRRVRLEWCSRLSTRQVICV